MPEATQPDADFDRAPCGLLTTTPDGTVVTINQTLLDWLGLHRGGVVGKLAFVDLLTTGGRIYHETHYRPTLQLDGMVREIAVELRVTDGSRLPVLVSSTLDRDPKGVPTLVRTAVFTAAERRRYERELLAARERAEASEAETRAVAQTLQTALLPPAPPDVDGLDIGAAFRPAGDGTMIGGDFYDIFERGRADLIVAIGDVCGKGVDAAAVAMLARHAIRAATVRHRRLDDVLDRVNDVLLRSKADRYCTVALLGLRRTDRSWQLAASAGGHPLPLLLRDGGAVPLVEPGALVGAFAGATYRHAETELRSGDVVIMYTDGVTEARRQREFYGTSPMLDVARATRRGAHRIAEAIVQDVIEYQAGVTSDDVAVVVISIP